MFHYEFICVKNNLLILILSILCISYACTEYPQYPDIPQVSYLYTNSTITQTDKHIDFTFLLQDGDGDVGLSNADTAKPYTDSLYYNFHSKIRVTKNNNSFILPYSLQYRIPQIRNKNSKKFIKADVTISIDFAQNLFPYDTIQLIYYVYDRALHKSNIDTSKAIIFYSPKN